MAYAPVHPSPPRKFNRRKTMRAFVRLLAFCILFACLANAQTATVKRTVILRAKPSTSSDNLATLQPKAKLTLINLAARNGFLHVQTEDGDKGWVYAKNVDVSDEEDAAEAASSVEDEGIDKLLAAHVDAVGQPLVIGGDTVCGPTGTAGNDDK